MKYLRTDYTFDALAKTIVFSGAITIEQIGTIVNLTDGIIIYNPADANKNGSFLIDTLTLDYNTTSMSDTDDLQIMVMDNAAVQSVSGTVTAVVNFPTTTFPAIQTVTGTFYQATQPVSGTVTAITDFPTTTFPTTQTVTGIFNAGNQTVTGTIGITNFPTNQTVTGVFNAGTQTVTGTIGGSVTVTNFPSGIVTVSAFPATQTVTGIFNAGNQTVTGSVGITNFPATQTVTGTFWQSNQPISGTVTAVLVPPADMVRGTANVTVSSDTSLLSASGSAALKTYIKSIQIYNTNTVTGTLITFKAGSGGAVLGYSAAPAGGGSNIDYGIPLVTPTNTAFYFSCTPSTSTVYIAAQGYTAP